MDFPLPTDHVLPHQIVSISPPELSSNSYDINRFIGSLIGLAVGDALGASVEFRPHQYFVDRPVQDMEGGGTWGLKAGQWTDDTSMALCLASSLITKKDYNPYDQMVRYKWWYKHGYLSSTGHCFDIGNATRDSLEEFSRRQNVLLKYYQCNANELDNLSWDKVQSVKEFNINCSSSGVAGNGALMRLAPLPLFFYKFPIIAVEYAGRSARLTHGDQKAVDACRYYAALIVAAVRNEKKSDLLNNNFYETHREWFGKNSLDEEILRVARGSYKRPNGYEDGIRGKGYIVNALEAALWAFWSDKDSFEKGALAAVNLGDDTDTTAAIYGQLAGACYGFQKIPKKWLSQLYANKQLLCIGQWLYFEGSQYKGPKEEQTTVSTTQSPIKALSSHHKDAMDYQSPTHFSDPNPSQTHQPSNTQLLGVQTNARQPPLSYQDSSRIQTHKPSEIPVSSHPEGVLRSPGYNAYSTQSHTSQRYILQQPQYSQDNNQLGVKQSSPTGMSNQQTAAYGSHSNPMNTQQLSNRRSMGNPSNTYSPTGYPTDRTLGIHGINDYSNDANRTRTRPPVNDYNLTDGINQRYGIATESHNTQRYIGGHNDPNPATYTSSVNRQHLSSSNDATTPYSYNQPFGDSSYGSNRYRRK